MAVTEQKEKDSEVETLSNLIGFFSPKFTPPADYEDMIRQLSTKQPLCSNGTLSIAYLKRIDSSLRFLMQMNYLITDIAHTIVSGSANQGQPTPLSRVQKRLFSDNPANLNWRYEYRLQDDRLTYIWEENRLPEAIYKESLPGRLEYYRRVLTTFKTLHPLD